MELVGIALRFSVRTSDGIYILTKGLLQLRPCSLMIKLNIAFNAPVIRRTDELLSCRSNSQSRNVAASAVEY